MNNVRNSEKKLVVLSAPSGAGKSSLLNNVISQHHDIGLTISHTTRDIRPSEKNNIDYYFISKEKFQAMINEEEFIEFAEVHGNFYGTTKKEIDEKFGFLIEALEMGAPPHGGIAFGMDRITMLIIGADSIRETIAFPKNQQAKCLLTNAPSNVSESQLKELDIEITIDE